MRQRRTEILLFLTALAGSAYFHPGGGWSQNGRFAMVRAIVERGTLAIDDFLVYTKASSGEGRRRLKRNPIERGALTLAGQARALTWGKVGRETPIDPGRSTDLPKLPLLDLAATGDLSFGRGHFYPNKAPGPALVAVPAYAAVRLILAATGAEPDGWWPLTVSGWLTTAGSVGLLAAVGVVFFFRLAIGLLRLSPPTAAMASLVFAFGTLHAHYATMLYEHDVIAVGLLSAFAILHRLRTGTLDPRRAPVVAAGAGVLAGLAVASNVAVAVPAGILGAYAWLARGRRGAVGFALGLLPWILLLLFYHAACFGSPWTTSYSHQNPLFIGQKDLLGVFGSPKLGVLLALLVSPFRGLFFLSPVLLLALPGLFVLLRDRERRLEASVLGVIPAFFLVLTASFNYWEGGYGAGPRYLVPAIPFVALSAAAFVPRLPRLCAALAVASVALVTLTLAVDPQVPPVEIAGRPNWLFNPVSEYAWPLFSTGRARPILEAAVEGAIREQERRMTEQGIPAPDRAAEMARVRTTIEASLSRPDGGGFPPASMRGPVSVNPTGIMEGWSYLLFEPGSEEACWNAFSAGEFVFPGSRLSLLPWLLVVGAMGAVTIRSARG